MRLSRHAKNRLRWLRRASVQLTEEELVEALGTGSLVGHDLKGNAHHALSLAGTRLVVVIDEREEVVVTIWREE